MLENKDLQQIGQILDEKLGPIKTDVSLLKTDVSSLRTDMNSLTMGLNSLATEVNSLSLEFADMKTILERIDKRTDEDATTTYGELEKLQIRVNTIEVRMKITQN